MRVGVFYNSIANPAKFSNKVMLMDNFRLGVLANGDEVVEYRTSGAVADQPLDAGFVLGYTLEDNFRKKIINSLRDKNIPQVFVDSNILHYSRPEHEWHRYSLNSVYPNDGIYFFDELNKNKWNEYSEWHGASLKPWRTSGNHILILAQRPHGWNMFDNDQSAWLDQTIAAIRQYSQRPIVVRMHPGDGSRFKQIEQLKAKYGNQILISTKENIRDELMGCWCSVGYNSTPNVVSAIEGVPVYVQDPVHSWAQGIAFTDLGQIENPPLPDRTAWADRIANIHWSNYGVKSGQLWAAIKKHIAAAHS